MIGLSLLGVLTIVDGHDSPNHNLGDIAGLSAAFDFAIFTLSLRKGRTVDMVPAVFWSGVLCLPVMVLMCV